MLSSIRAKTKALTEWALTANARAFAILGSFLGTPFGTSLSLVLTIGLLIGLSVGQKETEYEKELEDMWTVEGSRAEDEYKSIFNIFGTNGGASQYFYRVARTQPTDVNDHGILTKESLDNFKEITEPLLTGSNNISVTHDGITYKPQDICDRPPIPSYLKPFTPDPDFPSSSNPAFYVNPSSLTAHVTNALFSGSLASGALYGISRCISLTALTTIIGINNMTDLNHLDTLQVQFWYEKTADELNAFFNANGPGSPQRVGFAFLRSGLPDGWGIDRAPCTRSNILDCWKDGEYDLPVGLQQLGEYAPALLALLDEASQGHLAASREADSPKTNLWYPTCRTTIETAIGAGISGALNADLLINCTATPFPAGCRAQTLAFYTGLLSTLLDQTPLFFGAGHWFRPSIESQVDAGDFGYHPTLAHNFFQSVRNTYESETSLYPKCVAGGLFRGWHSKGYTQKEGCVIKAGDPTCLGGPFEFLDVLNFSFKGGCCHNWIGERVTQRTFLGTNSIPRNAGENPGSETHRFLQTTRVSLSMLSDDNKQFHRRLVSEKNPPFLTDPDNTYSEKSEILLEIMSDLDQKIIDYLEPMFRNDVGSLLEDDSFELSLYVGRSQADLFTEAATVEPSLLIAGYIALLVFACYIFIHFSCPPNAASFIYSRTLLCFSGMVMIGLSNLASFGFVGWIGFKLSPLNPELVPFLGVGLGLADLFVLIHTYSLHVGLQDSVQERIQITMADAGSSITITNAANAVAFLIPAGVIKIPAIYQFAYHMAASIILNWITVIFVIVPLCYLDAVRCKAKTSVILPCIKTDQTEADAEERSHGFSLHDVVKKYLCPLYVNPIFKVFSVCLFLGGTAFLGHHGFTETSSGLLLSDVTPEGTYLQKALTIIEEEFPLIPGGINIREIEFTDGDGNNITIVDFQENVIQLLKNCTQSRFIDSTNTPLSFHWMASFIEYYQDNYDGNATVVPHDQFYSVLREYLQTPFGGLDLGSIACRKVGETELEVDCLQVDGESIKIVFSQGLVFYNNIVTDEDYIDAINNIREIADRDGAQEWPINSGNKLNPRPMFFSGSLFRYWTQYVDIEDVMVQTVGYAMVGVVVTVFLLQFNFIASLLVGVMLLAITIQVYGLISYIDIKLNGFSMLNLATTVGLAVEMTAYVSYSYLRHNAKSEDPNERMTLAVAEMFPPMFQGSMTGFISVICLNFAKFPFFAQYYFQMVSLMIWLAFINGIWFLPIILSLVNPTGLDRKHRLKSLGSNGSANDKFVDDGL